MKVSDFRPQIFEGQGMACKSDFEGFAAKSVFHSPGVNSCTFDAGCCPTRVSVAFRCTPMFSAARLANSLKIASRAMSLESEAISRFNFAVGS